LELIDNINECKKAFEALELDKRDNIKRKILEIINGVEIIDKEVCKDFIEFKKEFEARLNPGTYQDALELEKKLMSFFTKIEEIEKITGEANDIAISKNGEYLAYSNLKYAIYLVALEAKDEHTEPKEFLGHSDLINDIALDVDRDILISCSNDHTLRVWSLSDAKEINSLHFGTNIIKSVIVNKITQEIVALSSSRDLLFIDVSTLKINKKIPTNRFWTKSVAVSSNGKYIVSANFDNSIIVYDVKSQKDVNRLYGHKSYVNSISIDHSGDYMVSSSSDGEIILWNLESGIDVKHFSSDSSKGVNGVAISLGGKYVAYILDKRILVYALDIGRLQNEKIKKKQEEAKAKEPMQESQEDSKKKKKKSSSKKKFKINIDINKYLSKFFKALLEFVYKNMKQKKG